MDSDKVISADLTVSAGVSDVWAAWTTEAGARTFFAPECKIELWPMGAYEMYFAPESPVGQRGGEGCRVLAVQPETMLAFSWNAPPSLPEVRGQYTHVVVRLAEMPDERTRVIFIHDGWGEGGQWDKAYDYFTAAWKRVVLPRLAYRFMEGPVDWSNPPDLTELSVP